MSHEERHGDADELNTDREHEREEDSATEVDGEEDAQVEGAVHSGYEDSDDVIAQDTAAEEVSDDYFGPFEDGVKVDTTRLAETQDDSSDPYAGPRTPSPRRDFQSPAESLSIPDDTPSLRGSHLSSPASLASPLPRKYALRTASGALQPFERRFESRLSCSPLGSPRVESSGFLSPGSRQFSLSSRLSPASSQGATESDEPQEAPWEVVRWTRLRKLTGQVFSETGRRNFGRPTCLAVSALIAVGTSKGFILGFDYHQTLKIIMGPGTIAADCGSVTALAISADYSTICSGHQSGHIFTWEVNRPARPFLQIAPIEKNAIGQPRHPDGHVADSMILHIGFLGVRHTAIVSADSSGMAFSHLASRGLGPVTRTVSTVRLLGRYPPAGLQMEQARKPSSVLAFSPLPLGNVEQPIDNMGLTALLTPYLLVIVSTTPTAQTQHKASRPKQISPHSTLSGCLAWFPSVKIKGAGHVSEKDVSDVKLVYCWANVLSILDVQVTGYDPKEPQRPPSLEFSTRNRWRAEESIVAVQWLGRSILGALTVSQRLLIIEDGTLQVTDSVDLMQRHLYHQDLFSRQLRPVVEQLDPADPSMHGVVADAFHMSFRAYKGRLFILSLNDIAVGSLSNWADRLIALMEAGDHLAAIRLATDYYTGSANNVTIGLSDDDDTRHETVKDRLLSMITAALQYTFAQKDAEQESRLQELTEVCFAACVTIRDTEYLGSQVFEFYDGSDEESIFVMSLEPYILDGDITHLPTDVIKSMVSCFISENQAARLEALLCRLEPHSFDLDEMTIICKQHNLYDALIYIWTQALQDFVTPLIDLLELIKLVGDDAEISPFFEPALKVFSYLAFSLTGRSYPRGEPMTDQIASQARADLYGYIFAGRPTAWPLGSANVMCTTDSRDDEPVFPYLTLLLHFDTASFMSMLNEAFEDVSLNETDTSQPNGTINGRSSFKITRQHIISIMLDVVRHNEFASQDVIFLDMFIARTLAKYPAQLVFSGTLLSNILHRLCRPPLATLHDDCQLSVEYLLSSYQPTDITSLLADLQDARFYRVMKTVLRRQKMYPELFEMYFVDTEDRDGVFETLRMLLSPSSDVTIKQSTSIRAGVVRHANDLVDIDTSRAARTIAGVDVSLLPSVLPALNDSYQRFTFLRTLFEPSLLREKHSGVSLQNLEHDTMTAFEEQYVQLMCTHDPGHVSDYVREHQSGDLRLTELLPYMEDSGVIDAEVMLLSRDGSFVDAMSRLTRHMHNLEQTMLSLLHGARGSPDMAAVHEAGNDLLEEVTKYTKVGIWLCQTCSKKIERRVRRFNDSKADEELLEVDEHLWLELICSLVQTTQEVSSALHDLEQHVADDIADLDIAALRDKLRPNVQQVFTSLLVDSSDTAHSQASTSSTGARHQQRLRSIAQLSFLRIFRVFLQRAAETAPSLADLRSVLNDVFSAYAFEQDVLTMANDLLSADVFVDIQKAHELRQRGWRPRTQICEACKRRAWGPGTGEAVWETYVNAEADKVSKRNRKAIEKGQTDEAKRLERGKGRLSALITQGLQPPAMAPNDEQRKLSLVVFACRHVYHRVCLDAAYRDGGVASDDTYKCPLCIDNTSV